MQIALKIFFFIHITHFYDKKHNNLCHFSFEQELASCNITYMHQEKKIEYIQVGNKKKLKEIKLISVSMLTSDKNNNNNHIDV
jgi:hypothetical protein